MKLLNDFYHTEPLRVADGEIRATVSFDAHHPVYQAHFPGNPVTPGVYLLQIATEILEGHLGLRLSLKTAGNIRFKKPIGPEAQPTFIFRKLNTENDHLSVSVSIETDDSQLAKMSLTYNIVK